MEKFDWKITISTAMLSLKLLGLWPEGETYRFNLYTLWSICNMTLFTFGHNFFQAVNLLFIFNDLQAIIATIFVMLSELLVIQKVYCIIKNMKILKRIMATLSSTIFQPKNTRQIKMVEGDMNFWKLNSLIYSAGALGAVFFWSTFPIFDNSIQDSRLPFLAWYPYNTKIAPNYQITYIYQVCGVACIATAAVSSDCLIAAMYMYIGAQLDILCDNITHVYDSTNKTGTDLNQKFLNCIHHHKTILEFAENCNTFSNWIILGQFFVSAVSIGLTMFQLTMVVPFSSEFYSLISFNSAIIVEIFMYCWFGNEIEVKSNKIPYAVFESDWTTVSPQLKKHMIFFVERCQYPLKMSALNLFYLSNDTFVRILRAAWSYFTLLHQLTLRK